MPQISGTLTIRGDIQVPYGVSFSDLFHHLDRVHVVRRRKRNEEEKKP